MKIDQRYSDGRETRLGDRVTYNGQHGGVVFVADRGEFKSGYDWKEYSSGVMVEFENGGRLLLDRADDHLLEYASG